MDAEEKVKVVDNAVDDHTPNGITKHDLYAMESSPTKSLKNNQPLLDSEADFEVPEEEMYSDLRHTRNKLKQKEILTTDVTPILYIRNVPSSDFYLILQGTVVVCSGQEGFMVELGPFNFLGVEALLQEDYKPDFSAKVINKARLLKITREEYVSNVSSIKNIHR